MSNRKNILFKLAMSSFLFFSAGMITELHSHDSHSDSHEEKNVFASYRSLLTQTLSSANPNITFEIEDVNVGNGIKTHNSSIFTFEEEGYYLIDFGVASKSSSNVGLFRAGFNLLQTRGTTTFFPKSSIGFGIESPPVENFISSASSSIIIKIKKNDKITLTLQIPNGSETAILIPGNTSSNFTDVAYITFVKLNRHS